MRCDGTATTHEVLARKNAKQANRSGVARHATARKAGVCKAKCWEFVCGAWEVGWAAPQEPANLSGGMLPFSSKGKLLFSTRPFTTRHAMSSHGRQRTSLEVLSSATRVFVYVNSPVRALCVTNAHNGSDEVTRAIM